MTNPFDDDADFFMTRATEAAAGETRAGDLSQDSQAGTTATKKVCPFCGAINDNDGQPCPRCLMEDTQVTRTATKSRIGPWFVLQARNPAAPGMKWATLIELVRKGVVVPRSIVRGPTTHQLWRAAGHVKGLSREFGLCYHCGADIDKGANQCPQCNKLQEPPINPDSLLEMREAKREMAREPQPQAPSPAPQPTAREPEAPAQEIVAPAREVRANADLETLAADLERFVMPSPNVPAPMRPPVHQVPTDFVIPKPPERTFSKPDASILSAKELAAAFQLEFQPQAAAPAGPIAPAPTKPEKKSHPILRTFLLLIFLAAIGAVTFFGLKPDYRDQALAWIQTNYQKVRSSLVAKNPTTPAMSTQNQTATAQPTPDETPLHPPEEITQPKPAPAPQPAPVVAQQQPPQPAPQVETPKPPPQPQPQPPAVVEDTKPQAPQMSWDDAYAQYKKLWVEALEAEGNKDYPLAIQKYEEIHKLRSDVWPKDLNERIAAAKTHLP